MSANDAAHCAGCRKPETLDEWLQRTLAGAGTEEGERDEDYWPEEEKDAE